MARGDGIEPVVGADVGGGSATPDVAAVAAELAALKAEREAEVAARAEEARKAEEAAAIARGETETLYKATKAEKDALEAEVKTYRKAEQARLAKIDTANEATIKAIPAEMKTLVPSGLKGEPLAEWLETNKTILMGGTIVASDPPRTRTIAPGGKVPAEVTEYAARMKLDASTLYAAVKKHPHAYPHLAHLAGDS